MSLVRELYVFGSSIKYENKELETFLNACMSSGGEKEEEEAELLHPPLLVLFIC